MKARSACLAIMFLLPAACNNMVQQSRYDEYEESPLFADGKAMQHPPGHTVARDTPQRRSEEMRPELTLSQLERGRERFGIYCTPCHARDGSGQGIVPQRGFPYPPDLRLARLRAAPASHFYDVITNGYGVMYSYADRVPPLDRWAIAAYIRALQKVQPTASSERPPS